MSGLTLCKYIFYVRLDCAYLAYPLAGDPLADDERGARLTQADGVRVVGDSLRGYVVICGRVHLWAVRLAFQRHCAVAQRGDRVPLS